MNRLAFALPLAAPLFLALAAPSASASDFGPYVKADGGANFITGTHLDIDGAPGNLSLDTGFRVDGAFGYQFQPWFAVEFEGGFIQNSVRSITLNNLTGSPQGDSNLQQIPLLANVVFRYQNSTEFVPYLGLGAGGVLSTLKVSGISDNDAVVAFQAKAGIIYKIMEEAWLDVGYRFLGTAAQSYEIGGSHLKTKDVLNQFVGLTIIWSF